MKLSDKEKLVLDLVNANGKEIIAENLLGNEKIKDLSIYSIRSTLARLDKTHGLIASKKVISGDKMKTAYVKKD